MKKILPYELFIKKGKSDLRASLKLMEGDDIESDIICFHLQQFIEKYIKTFLIYNKYEIKKVHDIGLLLAESIKIDPEFSRFEDSVLVELTDCGVLVRYDEIDEIDREFIESALNTINEFKSFVEQKLNLQ
jgi:HEPN domain-containing protein